MNSIDYLSNNPEIVIDINTLKAKNNLSTHLNKSNSSIINNINIHETEGETKENIPKNEITIDIDNATKIATITKEEEEKEKERNVKYVNKLYAKKLEKLNSTVIPGLNDNSPSSSTSNLSDETSSNGRSLSDESLNAKIISNQSKRKVTRSYDYLNSLNKPKPQKNNRLYNSNEGTINKMGLFENQAFLNKLVDRYSPQQRLSVSFNHLYDPLFVSNNLSKRYDIELKHVDLSIKDIYEHGLPYLLRSKRALIEFCKELIKECQIEILVSVIK
ncbi:hypothetical protein PIROE2DRAFT_1691 [Piromyces sp. E2]|nr:hypothetical protein PIROE2DRAFT_1691 [Piromyces sp. E2]|eukprot:OUM70273.1 hypothetical protein PIROE2DRAFT_1691 [Piromyces sp. E2]